MRSRKLGLLAVVVVLVAAALLVARALKQRPDRIDVTPDQLAFKFPRETKPLAARLLDRSGSPITGAKIDFVSSDPAVVTVDAAGVVTAVHSGLAKIQLSSAGKTAQVNVDVRFLAKLTVEIGDMKASVENSFGKPMPLEVANLYLDEGDELAISTKIVDQLDRPIEKAEARVATQDEHIAVVSKDGKTMIAKQRGVVPAAVDYLGLWRPFTIVVMPLLPVPVVRDSKMVLKVGETQQILAAIRGDERRRYPPMSFAYESDDESIAIANLYGDVTARKPGKTNVTVTLQYAAANVEVTVVPDMAPFQSASGAPPLVVTPGKLAMKAGETKQLTAVLKAPGARPLAPDGLTYWSADTTIAIVNAQGLVLAQKPGTTLVGVASGGSKAPVEVTVLPSVALATAGKRPPK